MNPAGQGEEQDGADQLGRAGPAPDNSRPDKDEGDKSRDGEQVRAAKGQASSDARDAYGGHEQGRQPTLRPAQPRQDHQIDQQHQTGDGDDDEGFGTAAK